MADVPPTKSGTAAPLPHVIKDSVSLSLLLVSSLIMHFHIPRVKSFTHIVDQVRDAIKHHKHEKDSEAHQVCLNFCSSIAILILSFRSSAKPQDINPKASPLRRLTQFVDPHQFYSAS